MALSVIKYNHTLEALDLKFGLEECEQWTLIGPNPNVADAFRNRIIDLGLGNRIQSTTIAKFLSDLFVKYFPDSKVSRKADLIPILATIWKMKFENEDSSLFHQAFELFTDLRSFTLDKNLMEELLQYYPEIIREAVVTFWLVVENQEIIDEHQAYSDLIEVIASSEEESFENGFIFVGFTHLSANQIELLKSIGKRTEVMIPLSNEVVKQSLPTDWVDWILTQADRETQSDFEIKSKEYEVTFFSKGRGNSVLVTLLDDDACDIIIPKKSIQFQNVLEIPRRDFFFKSELGLFSGIEKKTKQDIYKKLFSKEGEKTTLKALSEEIQGLINTTPRNRVEDFSKLKYYSILIETIDHYNSLSEKNELLTTFDLNVIFDITKLNLPRTFNIPLRKSFSFNMISLANLYQTNPTGKSYLYVTNDHDLSLGGVPDYPKEVQDLLVSLGPIRRQSLDLSFYLIHIRDLLSLGNMKLLIEEGLKDHDQVWSTFFEDDLWNEIEIEGKKNEKYETSLISEEKILNHKVEKLSASRMQTLVDCPAKYYYSYVDSINLEPEREETIDPRHLGEAQHAVVQDYLQFYNELDENILGSLVDKYLNEYLSEKIKSQASLYQECYAETFYFSLQTIEEFLKLKNYDSEIIFEFEAKIDDPRANGRIDVLIKSKKLGVMVFDLKRSGGSIPDKYKFQGMKSIQLWFYLSFLKIEQEYSAFGYINLSDISGSLLFYPDSDVGNKLQEIGFMKGLKPERLKEDVSSYLEIFNENFEAMYDLVNGGSLFKIAPLEPSVCQFCPGKLVCTKGVLS